jgi:hypothetical protein
VSKPSAHPSFTKMIAASKGGKRWNAESIDRNATETEDFKRKILQNSPTLQTISLRKPFRK